MFGRVIQTGMIEYSLLSMGGEKGNYSDNHNFGNRWGRLSGQGPNIAIPTIIQLFTTLTILIINSNYSPKLKTFEQAYVLEGFYRFCRMFGLREVSSAL